MDYKPTIGLEIHAELKTKTKMFCGCLNDPDEKHPNQNVCPVCLGHPGVLPVINKEAVRLVIKLGLALGGEIPAFAKFDRKNYFYPDLPKGYQISQYEEPLVKDGKVLAVPLTRVHLEEDAGRLGHVVTGSPKPGAEQESYSIVDFNRAGVPLMELVTEPAIHSAEEAVAMAKELQLILRYLNVSEANMEKGEMRFDGNVSISKGGSLGAKVEIKNLNSFKALNDALAYEIKRQTGILEKGERIEQETRGWDDVKGITVSQRSKEAAHDYRYMPEPDLPPLKITKEEIDEISKEISELPSEKRKRLISEYKLSDKEAEALIADRNLAEYFEEAVSEIEIEDKTPHIKLLFNYLTTDLRGLLGNEEFNRENLKITPEDFAELVKLIESGQISSRVAKDVLKKMFETGIDPHSIVGEGGLHQISGEEELKQFVEEAIVSNPKAVEDYKKGKANAAQFIVGQVMGKTKGRANPEVIKKMLAELLKQ